MGLQEPRELLAGDLAPFVSIENGRGAIPNDRFLRKLPRQGDSIKGELPAVMRTLKLVRGIPSNVSWYRSSNGTD